MKRWFEFKLLVILNKMKNKFYETMFFSKEEYERRVNKYCTLKVCKKKSAVLTGFGIKKAIYLMDNEKGSKIRVLVNGETYEKNKVGEYYVNVKS